MEPIYRQTFTVDGSCVDCFGRLKPSMILFYAQEVAGKHSAALSVSYDYLAEKRLFWAVMRHRVQITRLPGEGEHVHMETWPMPTTRVAYPRAAVAYDDNGNELFRIISLWILMDLDTRAMVLPGKSGIAVDGTLRGSELAVPNSIMPKGLESCRSRTVTFSDLDRNGHMNNTRYMEWSQDLLPSAFHRGNTVKDFVVCYLSEAREGEALQLHFDLKDGPVLQVDGHRESTDVHEKKDRVFSVQVLY